MKISSITALLCLGLAAATPARAAVSLEAGYSHFDLRDSDPERDIPTRSFNEPSRGAPFIAGAMTLSGPIALRLSYHYLQDLHTASDLAPGEWGPNIFVHGDYRDNVHLVTIAPEYAWSPRPRIALAISPQLHWVNSRGHVAYTTNSPDLAVPDPFGRNEHGFTLGISARIGFAFSDRAAAFVGYGFSDLDPSFGRQANIYSGGFSYGF